MFGQFAIYRARRYRLTRTVWRGVRFWMSGSGWAYAGWSLLWGIGTALTLGLLLPWREAALERYKMRHSYYGDLQGSFEGRGWEFFKRGWWLWLLAPFSFYLFPAAPFVYAAYKAVEWRWWLSGIRFGGVRLESTMRRGALIGLYWKVIGWFLLFAAAMGAYLAGCAALVASMHGVAFTQFLKTPALVQSVPLLVMAGVGYLATVLGLNIVMRVYLLRDLWAPRAGLDHRARHRSRGECLGQGRTRQRARRRFCRRPRRRRVLGHEHRRRRTRAGSGTGAGGPQWFGGLFRRHHRAAAVWWRWCSGIGSNSTNRCKP